MATIKRIIIPQLADGSGNNFRANSKWNGNTSSYFFNFHWRTFGNDIKEGRHTYLEKQTLY